MGPYSFNIADLASQLIQKKECVDPSKIPFVANKNKFTKVAFDMFQCTYDNTLWELAEENNEKYLIKRTDLEDQKLQVEATSQGPWTAHTEAPVVLYLFSVPVRTFSPKDFDYDQQSARIFANHITKFVQSNKKVARTYITGMSKENQQNLLKRCQDNMEHEEARLVYSWLLTEY